MAENIKLKMEKNLAVVELNCFNILSRKSREQFKNYIDQIIKNPAVHTALLIFKNTPSQASFRSFETDLVKQVEKIHGREKWERLLDEVHELFHMIENADVSWIAVLQGACSGNHLELALACDYRIADFSAQFCVSELPLGLIPCFGACIRLPRLIGVKKTLEIILKSSVISSSSACRIGLVDQLTHPLELQKRARDLTEQINAGHISPKPLQKYTPLRFLDKCFEIPLSRQILFYITKKRLLSETRGFYPAPLKVLEVIKNTYPVKFLKTALKEESDAFCDLIVSPTTGHLISLYLAKEKIQRQCEVTYKQNEKIKKAAVMGAGVMGGGITHWLANAHVPVLLKDIHSPSLSSTLIKIHSVWNKRQRKKGWNFPIGSKEKRNYGIDVNGEDYAFNPFSHISSKRPPLPVNTLSFPQAGSGERAQAFSPLKGKWNVFEKKNSADKIRPQMDYSGFHNVDMVIETVVEDIEIKKKVIAETAGRLSDKCLFATNTSSFSVTELAKAHPNPERFFGLHFFYPVYQTPLVEVVRGQQSSDSVIAFAVQWVKQMGKIPFVVKDRPGFLVHRLFLPLISEALWFLREGVPIQQVDQVYRSFGFYMGPFRLMDELGLDICAKLIKSSQFNELDFPEEFFKLRPVFLGKKNKSGFYIYDDKMKVEAVNNLVYQDLKLKPSIKGISSEECLKRGLYRMVNESARVLEEQVVAEPTELDLALILGIGFPAFRGGLLKYADEISLKTIVAGLNNFSNTHGKRFRPSKALLTQENKGKIIM